MGPVRFRIQDFNQIRRSEWLKMNEQMERLYQAAQVLLGKSGQSELGRVLNESPQVLANWESRGISAAGLLDAQATIGCDAIWLRDGTGSMTPVIGVPAHEITQLIMLYDQATLEGRAQIRHAALASPKKPTTLPAGNGKS